MPSYDLLQVQEHVESFLSTQKERPPERMVCLLASWFVLRFFLSTEWLQKHFLGVSKFPSDWLRSGAMFLPEELSKMERSRFATRLVRLADMLINLQGVEGF